jgi:esterase/lipase superfamily enzyme
MSYQTSHAIKREYQKWYSPHLQKEMELLVFGDGGKPVLFFPTRTAHFYDYEDWKVIDALAPKIDARELQIICVDSVDKDSFYNKELHPSQRIKRHELFEKYILTEVLPFIKQKNNNPNIISAGCSLGAYHAVNLAFRYPQLFSKVVGMSGRYDITIQLPFFEDLFEGYIDQQIFMHQPTQYLPHIKTEATLNKLKQLEIIIAIGETDAFLANNLLLDNILIEKGINHEFFMWQGEAHKAQYWSQMVQLYF